MTSVGCLVLLGTLIALPVALVGPAFGFPATLYVAYAIPPILMLFFLAQVLRFAVRKPRGEPLEASGDGRVDSKPPI